MTARVRQQDQLGKLDFLVVEGVMEMMQWANHGGEQQAGGQSLSNHRWWAVLVALIHEEGLECQKNYDVLGKEVFQVEGWRIPLAN
jgi:hypothetical protein